MCQTGYRSNMAHVHSPLKRALHRLQTVDDLEINRPYNETLFSSGKVNGCVGYDNRLILYSRNEVQIPPKMAVFVYL